MSNPFKIKKLEEFTIKDCESYLASYPYGEHHVEVKKRLSECHKGQAWNRKYKDKVLCVETGEIY